MNPTKAAAILALVVTLCAAGDLAYQVIVVRQRFAEMTETFNACEARIDQARREGKDTAAVSCPEVQDVDVPYYAWPSGITIVGLIASLALFGAANKQTSA